MAKSSVGRLVPKVPKVPKVPGVPSVPGVPGPGRRAAYSASTKRALVEVAAALFTEHGYSGTSLDSIVAGAQVTKGALYHHFSGKQALFEAVFEQVETDADRRVHKKMKGHKDPWKKASAGMAEFLQIVQDPGYLRIVVQDGPAVLGYERFREQEERSTFSTVLELVQDVLGASSWEVGADLEHVFAQIFFGALSTAGETVSTAEDRVAAARQVELAIGFLLAGFQSMVESSDSMPNALGQD